MIGVHVSEDAGRGFGQWVGRSMSVVFSLDPSHHAKTPHIVEVDRLEPEKAEVGEVYPVAAVFMASQILFPNGSGMSLWHRFGMTDQGDPSGPERFAIGTCLSDEETASRIGLQILGVHGHIANEEDRTTGKIKREGHQRAERKSWMLTRHRGQRTDRHQLEKRAYTLRMTWFRSLRERRSRGCMLVRRGGVLHRHRIPHLSIYGSSNRAMRLGSRAINCIFHSRLFCSRESALPISQSLNTLSNAPSCPKACIKCTGRL